MSAVRAGDDRAFEALYARYQRRITAYVRGMVRDASRAEDITQEVFVSALRRMRETERPITFKPWVYEIAKNACIDAYRRGRRAEEVSYDAEGGLAPSDYGRLVAADAGPVEAMGAKQELEHLTGAFGGLSETHHQILVLRELEGRSYADIGERLGMTRAAVESTLFRARKRLGEEYEELASGRRCERVQALITEGEVPRLGMRDQRKLARHLAHCQTCRRLAALTGVKVPAALPKRAADKLRSLLPIPIWFGRGGGNGGATMATLGASSGEPLVQAWSKAIAALVALAVAGAGVGVQPPARGKTPVTLVEPHRDRAPFDPGGAGSVGAVGATSGARGGAAATGTAVTRSSGATPKAGKRRDPGAGGGSGGSGPGSGSALLDLAAPSGLRVPRRRVRWRRARSRRPAAVRRAPVLRPARVPGPRPCSLRSSFPRGRRDRARRSAAWRQGRSDRCRRDRCLRVAVVRTAALASARARRRTPPARCAAPAEP